MRKFLIGAILGIASHAALVHLTPKECVYGQFIVLSPIYGAVIQGDQGICGFQLEFTPMTGPSRYN